MRFTQRVHDFGTHIETPWTLLADIESEEHFRNTRPQMTLVDLTLIMAAVNSRAPMHRAARDWWEAALNSDNKVALSWLVILGIYPLTTQFENHA